MEGLIKRNKIPLLVLLAPTLIYIFTLNEYYGIEFDNHYFHLLAWDILKKFKFYAYLGCHFGINCSLFSYILYPFLLIFGQNNFSVELVSALFHLANIFMCFRLGEKLYCRNFGLIFASFVALAPFYIINTYLFYEFSFLSFLNISSIYYFIVGFEERSKRKIIFSSFLYALSCLSAIYSLPLLLFFILYSLVQMVVCVKSKETFSSVILLPKTYRLLCFLFYLTAFIAFLYLTLLIESMYIHRWKVIYYLCIAIFLFLLWFAFKRLSKYIQEILKFSSLFIIIVLVTLLLVDLFVQLDIHFLNQRFGYYTDTSYQIWRKDFGLTRKIFYFKDNAVKIFDKSIFVSVLSSLFSEPVEIWTHGYFNISVIFSDMFNYYKKCFPPAINIFLVIGLIGLVLDSIIIKFKKNNLGLMYIFPLILSLAITMTFINTTNGMNAKKLYIMPFPYLFATLGVYYSVLFVQCLFANLIKIRTKDPQFISILTIISLVLILNLGQLTFLKKEVFDRYKYNKSNYEFNQFYHDKHGYYRNYKEVGDFLLRDAPLKKEGKFRSIFVYTMMPQSFFNTIDWYTNGQIKTQYEARNISYLLYGTSQALVQYLDWLFSSDPNIKVIYFGDLFSPYLNFRFFSEVHPDIVPYKTISLDEPSIYDCILYKFERDNWRAQLGL